MISSHYTGICADFLSLAKNRSKAVWVLENWSKRMGLSTHHTTEVPFL
jgi:hypothetical protein